MAQDMLKAVESLTQAVNSWGDGHGSQAADDGLMMVGGGCLRMS